MHSKEHSDNIKIQNGHITDPVLPKFESSEISQGALYDLSFELSNQNAKMKNNNHHS